jgi:DNA polymerase I-like protein with 3'-5' exonuclease and polymerase domains
VCVETEEESKAAIEELRKAKWSVFDVESGGVQFTKSFRLPCIAVTAEGSDVTYIWGDRKLADAKIRAPLLDYLCDPTTEKIGHNVKYDMVSIYSLWGRMPENVRIDTRILSKILDPECSAKLADLGYKVGYGGHKEENARGMQEAKDLVASILRDEKAQERASEKLALGELPKLPKKLKVPCTFESIGVDASLEAVIRNKNFEAEKWCFALVDRFVLYRYCAFDTVTTPTKSRVSPRATIGQKIERQ